MALKGNAEKAGRYPTLCHCRARHGNPIASGRLFRTSLTLTVLTSLRSAASQVLHSLTLGLK